MKKNDCILLSAVTAYSYLFYRELPGINLFLFTLLIAGLLWYKDSAPTQTFPWRTAALGSIISGFFVMWYGSPLTVIANLISLTGLAALTLNPGSSVLMAGVNSIYSYISSIPYMIIDYGKRKNKSSGTTKTPLVVKLMVFGIPLIITILFFIIYQSANPLFYNLTKDLRLDFIAWSWVGFTLLGFIWMYGLFYQNTLPAITEMDLKASDNLHLNKLKNRDESLFGKILSLDYELLSGIIMFSLLNLLLLSVNIVDIGYLWSGLKLPEGLTYSTYVHQGTEAIIFSVCVAILIILFYFRAHLNFAPKNNAIKILSYIWIAQNIFMIFSAASKNRLYIEEYSLTYERIGVYVFLLLTLIGLVSTFIKVFKAKSNVFLFRKNAWAFYIVLILSVPINWSQLVTDYNIEHSKNLDKDYLIDLNYTNTPTLLSLYPVNDFEHLPEALRTNIEEFKWEYDNTGWQSWCFHKQKVNSELKKWFKYFHKAQE